jgi:hypothetical protein
VLFISQSCIRLYQDWKSWANTFPNLGNSLFSDHFSYPDNLFLSKIGDEKQDRKVSQYFPLALRKTRYSTGNCAFHYTSFILKYFLGLQNELFANIIYDNSNPFDCYWIWNSSHSWSTTTKKNSSNSMVKLSL